MITILDEHVQAVRRTGAFTEKLSHARTEFNKLHCSDYATYPNFLYWLADAYGITIQITDGGSIPMYYYITDEQKYLMFMLKF